MNYFIFRKNKIKSELTVKQLKTKDQIAGASKINEVVNIYIIINL